MSDTDKPRRPDPADAAKPAALPRATPRTREEIRVLVEPLVPGALRFLRLLCGKDRQAEVRDHLHNVFAELLEKLEKLPPGADLPLVAKRLCRKEMRRVRQQAQDEIVELADVPEDEQQEAAPDPEAFLLTEEMQRLATATIAGMGEDMRTAFLMNTQDEVPAGEIAAALGLPKKTVSSRIDRANALLAEALDVPFVKRGRSASPRLPEAVLRAVKAIEPAPATPEEEKEEARVSGMLVAALFKLTQRHRWMLRGAVAAAVVGAATAVGWVCWPRAGAAPETSQPGSTIEAPGGVEALRSTARPTPAARPDRIPNAMVGKPTPTVVPNAIAKPTPTGDSIAEPPR
jgi:RNA polymerase sigma factor (sigma-70 family)